jgi:hypothetical protein
MAFFVGLDLGQSADYTALAVVEKVKAEEDHVLHLRHLERYPLRTPYPEIADAVVRLMSHDQLRDAELFVDGTGVGVAVTDLLEERRLRFTSITITGGEKITGGHRSYGVPKKDLVAALEVPFHNGALKVASGLGLWQSLREEMLNFRRKVSLRTGHDTYEHWRESDHDDLVLAAALACWGATRRPRLATVYSF